MSASQNGLEKLMDISLITSLYRAETHLPKYLERVKSVAGEVIEAGLTLEVLLIANDATPTERDLIDQFVNGAPHFTVQYVARETLYASWNRGIASATGQAVGFWNVDDARTPDALIMGCRRIAEGCSLVYFPHRVVRAHARMPYDRERIYPVKAYDPAIHRRMMKAGPFFMVDRAVFERVGMFDERFRISGDFEWCARATDAIAFCPVDVLGGTFYLHGDNLSDTGNPLQLAEENVVYLLRGAWEHLKPTPPEVMRETWAKWEGVRDLPPEVEAQLWGEGASERWMRYQHETHRKQRLAAIEKALRYLPKTFIDKTGIRNQLARFGIVKARTS